jgi:hypothetical protein
MSYKGSGLHCEGTVPFPKIAHDVLALTFKSNSKNTLPLRILNTAKTASAGGKVISQLELSSLKTTLIA